MFFVDVLTHPSNIHKSESRSKLRGINPKRLKHSDRRVNKITLLNKQGSPLNTISISHQGDDRMDIATSDNRKISYSFKRFKSSHEKHGRYYLESVTRSDGPTETYEYSQKEGDVYEQLISRKRPDGRFLINEYYKKGNNLVGDAAIFLDPDDPRIGRIKLQKAPVGADSAAIITHRYFYTVNEKGGTKTNKVITAGSTTVFDALNHKADYYYNDDQRLTSIQKWGDQNQKIFSIERLFWGDNNSANRTNLMTRSLESGNREVKICRTYSYDEKGNVEQECLWGESYRQGRYHPIS